MPRHQACKPESENGYSRYRNAAPQNREQMQILISHFPLSSLPPGLSPNCPGGSSICVTPFRPGNGLRRPEL